ncbi:hypothetical protein [Halapricum desulfuricans]|uniref:DUF8147 domain-containing protein n=1 Tax=Halapricum desulfuricans TaxID=2841257 RepID=A0A897N8E2_9EURY|nr:hypothetical protein [Halapricum desulfuricans]QSG07465.1 hypothetical protein HSR122_0043 [Halapricum desulfuricans]
MDIRTVSVALGTGFTVALLVAVVLIEALPYEFSAIVGLPVGLLIGTVTVLLVAGRYARLEPTAQSLLDGTGGFGYAVVLLLGVLYVDFAGLGARINLATLVGVALLVAAFVAVVSWIRSRGYGSLH